LLRGLEDHCILKCSEGEGFAESSLCAQPTIPESVLDLVGAVGHPFEKCDVMSPDKKASNGSHSPNKDDRSIVVGAVVDFQVSVTRRGREATRRWELTLSLALSHAHASSGPVCLHAMAAGVAPRRVMMQEQSQVPVTRFLAILGSSALVTL
jgi:hypothetical protein